MSESVTAGGLLARLATFPADRRRIVAIAGAPASGKSTLAEWLGEQLPGAAVVPMDGFHYDDAVLDDWGLRGRKGSPPTFDVDGFAHLLDRLARDDGRAVAVPVFDRGLEISRAGGRIIPPERRLIIVEGNYLLLDEPGWRDLAGFFDLTVMVRCPEAVIETRLLDRWRDRPDARAWIETNDMPNARTVIQRSRPADLILGSRPIDFRRLA